ncbi:PucR family transcriptional regulator [Actinokineospora globicatena]|uniref:PucR family transcriptional regulator n=1 Tax=Actinokineospora globicatena TaxID=103729 RepID=UPI0020A3D9DF|nr:PucR family transcriptional regulator [Actinokineospora globicatena]GLW77653.1 hypothetical protein Aglo01_21350 [Actinokineospora globicatena]GLW84489.1 hypothetical protein Aglo02_21290 [Actinokineospora globicatena]
MGAPTIMSPLPPELRDLAEAQLARVVELADELAVELSAKEMSYREVNAVAPAELRKVCEVNLRHAFTAFIAGGEVALEAARKTGRAQARQGIPLSAVLRAFRIAGTFTYEALMERAIPPGLLTPEQLLPISATVWRIIDSFSDAIATAYSDFEADSARQDRAAVAEALLEGRLSHESEYEEAARALGLPVNGPYVVTVGATLFPSHWQHVAHNLGTIVLVPRGDLSIVRQSLSSAVGVSPVVSLRHLPWAVQRARIALRCLAPGETGVVVFGDRAVTSLVAGSPKIAGELSRLVLGKLLALPVSERDVLIRTLVAWFEVDGSAKEAGERLFVHPNTVRYRIRRVQELTGRDQARPRDGAELLLAVEAARLAK